MLARILFYTGLLLLGVILSTAHSAPPDLIGYQGRLLEGGQPVNGPVEVQFRLFNVPNSGTSLYDETQTVTAVDGLYSTAIGRSNAVPGSLVQVLTNGTLYLELEVDGTLLLPREQLYASPFALSPDSHSLDAEDGSPTDVVTVNPAGFVGVNRSSPVTTAEAFGIYKPTTSYGGMYVKTDSGGWPFYGYATDGADAWHYYQGSTSNWNLYVKGERLTVSGSTGHVGVGTTLPTQRLDVNGQVRIRGGNPGEGKVLVSGDDGSARWEHMDNVFFGYDFDLLNPDVVNNTASLQIDGVSITDPVVVLSGPGLQIERVPGFGGGGEPDDQSGFNTELPFIFETSGNDTNVLNSFYTLFQGGSELPRTMSLIIRDIGLNEIYRWNLYEFGPSLIEDGTDGRTRYTFTNTLGPNSSFQVELGSDTYGCAASINPATDLKVEIEGIVPACLDAFYPAVTLTPSNRTVTLIMDYNEAKGFYTWTKETAENGSSAIGKKSMSLIYESSPGNEQSRTNYFGVFPIQLQESEGFGQEIKIKQKVVLSYDVNQPG